MSALPPVLYWSSSLAGRLNEGVGEDPRHGLVDFTDADWPTYWIGDGDFWCKADGLPEDAVRLVAEAPATEVTTEWGVRWIGGDVETSSEFTEDGMRSYIADMDAPAVLVRREKRVTAWTGVAT